MLKPGTMSNGLSKPRNGKDRAKNGTFATPLSSYNAAWTD